jgi:uncharacterized RDD family membrane protein YckC
MTDHPRASIGRRIGAGILDFITVFFGGGYLIAKLTGNTTEGGFSLSGFPAVVLFVLVAAYFVAGHYYGGTIWQRVLGSRH